MEGKQHTQSIIAKLMGLEEFPHKLPLPSNNKRKVLSENYLQKTASIGLREKSSILVGRSTRINTEKHQEVVKVSQMPTSMSTRTTFGDTMRSVPKMETGSPMGNFGDFGIDHKNKIEFHFEPYKRTPHTKIIVLAPSSGRSDNIKNHLFSLRSDVEMESVNSEYKKFKRTENGPVDVEEADGEGVVNRLEPLGNSFRVPREISQKTTHSVWDKVNDSSKPIARASKVSGSFLDAVALKLPSSSLLNNTTEDGSLHSFANRSFLSKVSKKQINERYKLTNARQEIDVGYRSYTLGEMRAMAELEARPQYMDSKHDRHCFMQIRRSGSCSHLCVSGKDGSKYEHSRISPLDSIVASGTPNTRLGNEASKYGWHLRKNEIVDGEDSKTSNLKQKAGLECRDLGSGLDHSSGSIGPCISSAYGQLEEVNKMIDDENEFMLEKDSLYRCSKHASEVPHCIKVLVVQWPT